jgi:starch synthase
VVILHASSEVYPLSRSGGLADVLGVLPAAQRQVGADQVFTVSPWYGSLQGQPELLGEFGSAGEVFRLGRVELAGVIHLLIGGRMFEGADLYGYRDDVWRFVQFDLAVIAALQVAGLRPDVVHAHDWATGLLPALLRYGPEANRLGSAKLVYTIHNLNYQGRWNLEEVRSWSGLPAELFGPDGLEFYGDANLMKAGIRWADLVTTVSPTYAREITTPERGEGLDGMLRQVRDAGRLVGILNGLDQQRWDPAHDPYASFQSLTERAQRSAELRAALRLDRRPILSMVTRIAEQKGIDLVLAAAERLSERWNLVLLGSGDPGMEAQLSELARSGLLTYRSGIDEALAHRIYAGSDAFLMPSHFEPCGLSQMIAQRYGCLPVVRRTGGLIDTVSPDIGFLFDRPEPEALLAATDRAADLLGSRDWKRRVRAAMRLDWSWEGPARAYLERYAALRPS